MDSQVVELIGRNRLINELLRSGLEVAIPERDRGVDLIAYVDLESDVNTFIAKPIQMKASSVEHFSIFSKYAKFHDLILAFVWHLEDPARPVTYALTYPEAVAIGDEMEWTKTSSWKDQGGYSSQRPSKRLVEMLQPHAMSPEAWWKKVVGPAGSTPIRRP